VHDAIENYAGKPFQDASPEIQRWVTGVVRAVGPRTPHEARTYLSIVTSYATWAAAQGLPLDTESLLTPANVEHYCTVSPVAKSKWVATTRTTLRRIGAAATAKAPWEPPPARYARPPLSAPYTEGDVAQLVAQADLQHTAYRLRLARAVIWLGLGAGLDGRTLPQVRPRDITKTTQGYVVVHATNPDRVVPVLAPYAERVHRLAADCPDTYLIGGTPHSNRMSAVVARINSTTPPVPIVPTRLRHTWLVGHLRAGTRLPELLRAAGLQTPAALKDLLPYLDPFSDDAYLRALAHHPL